MFMENDWQTKGNISPSVQSSSLDLSAEVISIRDNGELWNRNYNYKNRTLKRMKMADIGRHLQLEWPHNFTHFGLSCQVTGLPQSY